jgi:uracil-DNA glycosylase
VKPAFLKSISIDPAWEDLLSKEIRKMISGIEKEVAKSDFTPLPEKVLRFLTVPINSVKIVIVGQDPYPQPGVATGRAFEVGTLKSWSEPFNNISLKNILRAIYKSYSGQVIPFNRLKAKFDNEFPVLPPARLFSDWEEQGVLLLNTSFTCETGKPGSHRLFWEEFSRYLFSWINESNMNITWFLWGSHAQKVTSGINLRNMITSMHPMMCFDGRKNDFLYGNSNCFEATKNLVRWTGFEIKSDYNANSVLF